MDYREKYLKYKNKYINLQKYYLQLMRGGNVPNDNDRLIDCYIASSHNTYLVGDQLFGAADIHCYLNFIKKYGGGCVEMDIVSMKENKGKENKGKEDVYIKHTGTLTNGLYLRDILSGIKDIINTPNQKMYGPVILSFDNKDLLHDGKQQIIWAILREELAGILYENYDPENLIIKNIIGKILIKWNQRVDSVKCDCESGCMIRGLLSKELKPCKNLIKPNFYNDTYKFWTHMNQFNTTSFEHKDKKENKKEDEKEDKKEDEKEDKKEDEKEDKKHQSYDKILTQNRFIRIFPPGGNRNSENYPFMKYIIDGAQLVALNIQTQDFHTMFQMEFFRNGCLRKKPNWLLKLNQPEYIEYKIFFPKELTNIEIYTDDNDKKIDISGNDILINVIKELEIIYVECKYDNKEYKGAITLTSNTNTLYPLTA